ncbi:helix-turn-helix transcriptional regulator [Bradyrhizobium uaiense]|uniref:Helix-turn-helix transcriptional regulator n=1 Tax=Bradyrhizobium uaiense TaxID=2594946 RepID=A0A6P1BDS1_9BRAD|nr:helix-turn-helix transcriptional regulator [Bradyrhizobium uaiense]NEU95632.1 helix-turn-helix transcriptional regulator [Bradyrhizobium uaiense]
MPRQAAGLDNNHFSDVAVRLVANAGRSSFETELIAAVKNCLAVDVSLMLLYRKNSSPRLLFHDWTTQRGAHGVQKYLKGPYMRDPFYQIVLDRAHDGLYRLNQIAPRQFSRSRYYQEYYRHYGLHDEFNYLFNLDEHTTFALSLSRKKTSEFFTPEEARLLRDLEPLIQSAVTRHWEDVHVNKTSPIEGQLASALRQAIQKFGTGVLTERECEVARLILHGYSLKGAAEKLSISDRTVKLHRSNLYAKLDVKSHGEMFALFLNSIMSAPNAHSDPLASYL